ncbi:MAG: Hsp20/alpha crystallin family protein [Bacteroidia bacterium]|nr:Hsp20/alpha crystallin family protein [Bacteroidia bacterium]
MTGLIPTNRRNDDTQDSSFRTYPTLTNWFDEVLNNNFGSEFVSNFNTGISLPAVNVIEQDDNFVVEMAIPGLKKSDFDISLDNQILSISAETKSENEDEGKNFTRREFGYSSFKRTFKLPKTVETEKISANYKEGILKVELPKRDEAKKKPIQSIKIS